MEFRLMSRRIYRVNIHCAMIYNPLTHQRPLVRRKTLKTFLINNVYIMCSSLIQLATIFYIWSGTLINQENQLQSFPPYFMALTLPWIVNEEEIVPFTTSLVIWISLVEIILSTLLTVIIVTTKDINLSFVFPTAAFFSSRRIFASGIKSCPLPLFNIFKIKWR